MGFDDFKQLVDNMQINLYLTDIQTNEIKIVILLIVFLKTMIV